MYYSFPGTFTVDQGTPQIIVRDPVIDGGLYRMVKKCDAVFPVLNLKLRTYAQEKYDQADSGDKSGLPGIKNNTQIPHSPHKNNK